MCVLGKGAYGQVCLVEESVKNVEHGSQQAQCVVSFAHCAYTASGRDARTAVRAESAVEGACGESGTVSMHIRQSMSAILSVARARSGWSMANVARVHPFLAAETILLGLTFNYPMP